LPIKMQPCDSHLGDTGQFDIASLTYTNNLETEIEIEVFKNNGVFLSTPISSYAKQSDLKIIAKEELNMYLYHRLLRHQKPRHLQVQRVPRSSSSLV
jgi:hypothetical protein